MNTLGNDVLKSTVLIGSGIACGAFSPLGMTGGAIIGGCLHIGEKPIEWFTVELLNLHKGQPSLISKAAYWAISIFATAWLNFEVTKALGFSFTSIEVLALVGAIAVGAGALYFLADGISQVWRKLFPSQEELSPSATMEQLHS